MPEENIRAEGSSRENVNENVESKGKKIWRICKRVGGSIVILFAAGSIAAGADIYVAKNKKDKDKAEYGEVFMQNDSIFVMSPEGKTVFQGTIDDIIQNNSSLLADGFNSSLLNSIMLGEDSLKTKNGGWIKIMDDRLNEEYGVERSPSSESYVGKILSLGGHTGSYRSFQTQREMFDKYAENPELQNKLCNDVANFRMPNVKGKYEELYKQLGYEKPEDMANDIKNHKIDMYKLGGRVGDVCGFVGTNEIYREINDPIGKFNAEEYYKKIQSRMEEIEDNEWVAIAKNRAKNDHQFRNNLMTLYALRENGSKIGFQDIVDIYKSIAFQNGTSSALWCTDNIKALRNCTILNMLQLMELNDYFESNGEYETNIVEATGAFGPTCIKLVNKHFNQNFENKDDALDYLNKISEEEFNNMYEQVVKKHFQNMRMLFKLGNSKDNPEKWTELNDKQINFLKMNMELNFNQKYVDFEIIKKYVRDNMQLTPEKEKEVFSRLDASRNSYTIKQNKESYKDLIDIMVNFDRLKEIIGCNKKEYMDYLKGYLGPALLGNTGIVEETKLIIPEIQSNPGGTNISNEQNSLRRFGIGVEIQENKEEEFKKGVIHEVIEGENDFNAICNVLWSDEGVRNYLIENCMTYDGRNIESPNDIPGELIYEIIRTEEGERIDSVTILKLGDKIRLKTEGLEKVYDSIDDLGDLKETRVEKKEFKVLKVQKDKKGKRNTKEETRIKEVTKIVTVCRCNKNGTYEIIESGEYLQNILFKYAQDNPKLKRIILKMINKEELSDPKDIPANVIKEIIRKPNGEYFPQINKIGVNQPFIIVTPLNYKDKGKEIRETIEKTKETQEKIAELQYNIFKYAKSDSETERKILKRINKEKLSYFREIPTSVIKEMVTGPDGKCFSSIDEIDMNKMLFIGVPPSYEA